MRVAGLIVLLVACASGGKDNPDAGDGTPVEAGPDGAPTCGGANQLPCDGVYVAKNGNDAGAGTKGAPVRTIAVGIAKAMATSKKAVFVKAGVYNEQVAMVSGITVYGGFDDTWSRNAAVETQILATSPAVKFENVTGSMIDTVKITANDAVVPGESSFAVLVKMSTMVEMRDVEIEAGIGAVGVAGVDGVNGANGNPGMPGNPGLIRLSCGITNNIPSGGVGGLSPCGRFGGQGGAPGTGTGEGGNKGVDGAGGTLGGNGAVNGTENGFDGSPGMFGVNGVAGNGGSTIGGFIGASYVPAKGNDGQDGSHANGGGGGGGGGGGTKSGPTCTTTGSSAGGGGAGGCGGTGGKGGGGGGGSFGVIAQASSVVIRSSTVTASRGGTGGRGGNGSLGGTGGLGGAPGPYGGLNFQGTGGLGFAGGRGGDGGTGGPGGGGGGGPSASVVCLDNASITIPQTQLVMGSAGMGGDATNGNPGSPGTATTAVSCQFF